MGGPEVDATLRSVLLLQVGLSLLLTESLLEAQRTTLALTVSFVLSLSFLRLWKCFPWDAFYLSSLATCCVALSLPSSSITRYTCLSLQLSWLVVPHLFLPACAVYFFSLLLSFLSLVSLSYRDFFFLPVLVYFSFYLISSLGDHHTQVTVGSPSLRCTTPRMPSTIANELIDNQKTDEPKSVQREGEVEEEEEKEREEDLKERIRELEESLAHARRINKLRNRFLERTEHRVNNPAQAIVFVIEEITALLAHWTDECSTSESKTVDSREEEGEMQADSETVTVPPRRRLVRNKSFELNSTSGRSSSSSIASEGSETVWQQRVGEFNTLADMVLSAVDSLFGTCSDIHDSLDLELLLQDGHRHLKQPSNISWVLERCEYAVQFNCTSRPVEHDAPAVSVTLDTTPELKTCITDNRWIFSILLHFLSNAKRFTSAGSIVLKTRVVARPSPEDPSSLVWEKGITLDFSGDLPAESRERETAEYLRFEVIDTGRGVEPSSIPNLFSLESRAAYEGFGLFLTARKVRAMYGRCGFVVNQDSSTGTGSIFWFEVPYVPTDEAPTTRAPPRVVRKGIQAKRRSRLLTTCKLPIFDPQNIPESLQASAAESVAVMEHMRPRLDPAQNRILVVEDDEIQRRLIAKQLSSLGYDVFEAKDGEEGLAMMKERQYRLVLCDKIMPRMYGDETVRLFRQWEKSQSRPTKQYICGFSANRENELPLGFDLYLTKPIKRADLLKVLMVDNK